jgi:hypothetical protein
MHPTVIGNSLAPSIDQVNEALKAEMHEKEKILEKRRFFPSEKNEDEKDPPNPPVLMS